MYIIYDVLGPAPFPIIINDLLPVLKRTTTQTFVY
jgi:tryptophan synthase beta subunit